MVTSPVKIWRNQKKLRLLLGQTGQIKSYTLIRVPPSGFKDLAPYAVAVIELKNKSRLVAQLVDFNPDHLRIGQKVITLLRRVHDPREEDVIPYGIKVKPI